MIVLILILTFLLYRTRWGLRLRAVGQFPMAAQTAGINVISMKYQAILISGLVGAWPELICHWDIVLCLQKI